VDSNIPWMTDNGKYLQMLAGLLEGGTHKIPFWLEDLLLLGPRFEQWNLEGLKPNRMLLTELLARWSKFAGLSEEACLAWLMPFCCELLAKTSKTGPSGIRHGTLANTRWVYKSPFPFDFDAMVRELPEGSSQSIPPYMPLFARWWDLLNAAKDHARKSYVPPVFTPVLPVKQRFNEQFQKGLAFAREKTNEGEGLASVVALLTEQGFLTRTGRKWSESTLHRELRKKT
jgi:hypothetical protein